MTSTKPLAHAFSNGTMITFKPISRLAVSLIRVSLDRKFPKPVAPVETTDLGDIQNTADPAHEQATRAWEWSQMAKQNIMLLLWAVQFADVESIADDLAALDAERAEVAAFIAANGLEQPDLTSTAMGDYHVIAELDNEQRHLEWLYWCAGGGNGSEIMELISAVNDTINSQREDVSAAMSTFRS